MRLASRGGGGYAEARQFWATDVHMRGSDRPGSTRPDPAAGIDGRGRGFAFPSR
jgi:hypothetical protein